LRRLTSTLREDHAEDVSIRRQRHEHTERPLCLFTEHVPEERSGEDPTGTDDLRLGHRGEVGDVDEHVHDGDRTQSERRGDLERADGVLGFGKGVVGVAVPDVRPDHVVERGDDPVGAPGGPFESVGEVVGWVDLERSAKCGLRISRTDGFSKYPTRFHELVVCRASCVV
jgi:hypothetical protein